MNKFILSNQIKNKVEECIVISGSARSGNTIVGKIIHSMKDMEYILEPPMMFCLFPLLPVLDETNWRMLYEVYLYEEFLLNALAGRAINCNKNDDSSIYNCKSEDEINSRLNHSFSKIETQELAKKSKISFKLPSIVPFIPNLKTYYPNTRTVITLRNPVDVFYSILPFGWFTDQGIKDKNLIWPNRLVDGNYIPFFVKEGDEGYWRSMDELNRTAYYYIRMYESISKIPDCLVVRYEKLISDPRKVVEDMAKALGLSFGDKTLDIIDSIKPRKYENRNEDLMGNLRPEVKEKITKLPETAGYLG